MGLFNSCRQSFENRFEALEDLLGLPAGPVRGLLSLAFWKSDKLGGLKTGYGAVIFSSPT
jgi:hypothetical protein